MNQSFRQLLLLLFIFPALSLIFPTQVKADEVHGVYMLRLDDEIGSSTWRYTRQALDEASHRNAELLIVHLNTYGGSVVHADSIRTALLNFPGPTVAFVDNNAASAGALIALACDSVFMRSGATMGAVTVVNGTDGQAMPDKYQSYMRAMMRATAERHGKVTKNDGTADWRRNPVIAEAMVDPRVSVAGLIDSTRVLTFTADEAVKWNYADGKAESVDEIMQKLGYASPASYIVSEYHPTWLDHLVGFLTNPAVQAVLIMLIIGGIYMELHSPGVGFPSAAAIIAAIMYFLPLYISGIASSWIILLFVLGIMLIILEVFVVPGFGITGIAGISCVCAAVILGLIEHYTFSLSHMNADAVWSSMIIFLAGIGLAILAIWYLTSSYGPKWVRRHTELMLTQQVDEGYIGVDMKPVGYIGLEGTAVTDMRPAGKVEINDEVLDAVAVRGFIHAGARVRVMKYENAQIYVAEV
ncbi:MAG: nodulation protein NfeD [Duncaniella sp.]|uniref:NfeD family protein n=1 Tax=Duncaniella sp. TaxID=2518496 RepID=UPI0023C8B497|nr:NfeD family protein [Duncaniella sp.]MDE5989934.1 nodulation protein NfeD [Duncaniella sp.]